MDVRLDADLAEFQDEVRTSRTLVGEFGTHRGKGPTDTSIPAEVQIARNESLRAVAGHRFSEIDWHRAPSLSRWSSPHLRRGCGRIPNMGSRCLDRPDGLRF